MTRPVCDIQGLAEGWDCILVGSAPASTSTAGSDYASFVGDLVIGKHQLLVSVPEYEIDLLTGR